MSIISNLKNNPEVPVIIKVLLACSFWGGTYIAGKIATPYVTPSVIGFLRFSIAALVLFFFCYQRDLSLKIKFQKLMALSLISITGCVLFNIFIQLGLQTVTATRTSLLAATPPFFITLGAIIFFREKINGLQFIGMLLTIIGAVLIVCDGNYSDIFASITGGDWYILSAMVCWVLYVLLGKKILGDLNPFISTTWVTIISAVTFLPLACYELMVFENTINFHVIGSALYLGLLGTVLAYVWFADGIKILGAARTSVFLNFEPVAAVIFAIILLGETLSLTMAVGGIITLSGVYLTNPRHKKS